MESELEIEKDVIANACATSGPGYLLPFKLVITITLEFRVVVSELSA